MKKLKEVRPSSIKDVEAKRMRQRIWAKTKYHEYVDALYKLGKDTFDKQPKEIFI